MNAYRRTGLLLALLCFVIAQVCASAGWLDGVENGLLAWCFRLRGPREPAAELRIVAIDPAALRSGWGREWPPQYGLYAQIVRKLREAGAAAVALDVESLATFGVGRGSRAEIEALARELRASGKVVLPCVLQPGTEGRPGAAASVLARYAPGHGSLRVPLELRGGRLTFPPDALCAVAAGVGHINIYPGTDGAVRSLPLFTAAGGRLWPSLALEAVRVYRGLAPGSAWRGRGRVALGDASVAVTPEAEMFINFSGGFRHLPHTALTWLLRADAASVARVFAGKLVIVGPTASTGLYSTPVHPMLPGVELTANAVENLLHQTALVRLGGWLSALCALALALLLGGTVPAVGPVRGAVISVLVVGCLSTTMMLLFVAGVWLPMATPLAAAVLAGISLVTNAAALADRDRARAEAHLESRMQAIAGIGSLIVSSGDRTQLLNEIVRWVERELDVPAVSILLMDERRRRLRFEIASGEKGTEVKSFTLELGQGVAGMVAATGEPLIVQEARKDPRQARDISDAIGFPAESILCVPMVLHGEVIGVIETLNKRSGAFTAYDQALLTVIGQQAALFLESAQLYSELQQRVDEATAGLREANRSLATQKAKIETLVDELESGVIATDAHDRVVTWNRAAEHLVGVTETRAMGEPALAVIRHPRLSELFALPLSPLGGRHAEDIEFGAQGHTVIARVSITLVREDEGFGKLALLTDITQLKELDQMKMDLVSFVSHELRSPLSAIKGFTHLIQGDVTGGPANARLVRLLSNQVSRMQWLVEDLLDVARIEVGIALELQVGRIEDLRAMIQEIVDLHAISAADHTFVVEVSADTPPLNADRGKLEQVLMNVVGNAVKYSPDGGEVRVSVAPHDGELTFTISDEGIGISAEELPNLFQRFQRARSTRERISGTGIGLFLCRHLVEAHGGRMWAERRPKGTSFCFALPLSPSSEKGPLPDAPTGAAEAG